MPTGVPAGMPPTRAIQNKYKRPKILIHSKKRKFGLLPRIVVAILPGIGAGMIMPGWGARIFAIFNGVFSAFLGFIVPSLYIAMDCSEPHAMSPATALWPGS